MAYATANPPRLISQGVGASSGSLWHYTDGDPIATVLGTDYFSDGDDLGMEVNDTIIITDETNTLVHKGIVSAVTSGGAATVSSSEGGQVVSGSGATVTLTAAQSGSTVLFDRAAGIVFTLPAPVVGLKFRFVITTTITSNAAQIDTDAATTFLVGAINQIIDASATSEGQFANGTSHVGISMNGTTTGGIKGTVIDLECINSTQWMITGLVAGSGTLATPFTT